MSCLCVCVCLPIPLLLATVCCQFEGILFVVKVWLSGPVPGDSEAGEQNKSLLLSQ